ncbi:uncharacterized protein LOC123506115 isoform X2 [Portunus trituberculatus]|uniref:uncharacterized protein LOC123506115 isoform X2 n=1 Tax=Portunus trituberculatus TaxID=210409 RepID=UPI001E1D1BAF|nr:uncharacterized protein LOC123506115 isoform X2 [Portunus trituberculatus]
MWSTLWLGTTVPDVSCTILGDHTYGACTQSETAADPVDVEVQTDQCTTLEKASQTHECECNNAGEDGALHNAFIQKILSNTNSIKRYTGMQKKDFYYLFNLIKENLTDIHYWRRPNKVKKENIPPKNSKASTNSKLSWFHEYLMTLVHIRTGYDVTTLGDLFEVSLNVASSIIITWINVLYLVMKDWLIWPTAAQVRASLPDDFPKEYSDTRTILDCTEMFTVKPTNPSAQAATPKEYSDTRTILDCTKMFTVNPTNPSVQAATYSQYTNTPIDVAPYGSDCVDSCNTMQYDASTCVDLPPHSLLCNSKGHVKIIVFVEMFINKYIRNVY